MNFTQIGGQANAVEYNVDGKGGEEVRGNAEEDFDLPVDLCITRDLDPAVTFREGVERIKVAISKLKEEPLCCRSGVIRFQVSISYIYHTSIVQSFTDKMNKLG